MLSKARPEAKVRGRARRMQGCDWELKAQEAYAEGLTEESNYLRGGSEV